jgi:hypothetical protein
MDIKEILHGFHHLQSLIRTKNESGLPSLLWDDRVRILLKDDHDHNIGTEHL